MHKALVLGGKTGMLGQALMKVAKENGYEAISLGREDCSKDIVENSVGEHFLSQSFLEKQIECINPDIIFNAIAYTAVDNAEDDGDNAYALNKTLPAYLANILKGSSCHLVHYSTDFVFDGMKKTPYVETDKTNPLCVYGASKLAGEEVLNTQNNTTILRTAWLFGLGRKNFVSTMLHFAKERPLLRVVSDQFGCPTSTKDLAHMGFLVAKNPKNGIYHAVNSGMASWHELAQTAISFAGFSTVVEPITTSDWPQRATRPPYSVLSTEKFQKDFSYSVPHWKDALKEYILAYQQDKA